MGKAFSTLLMFIMTCTMACAQAIVIDQDSNEPVEAASVFNNDTGKLIGLTNNKGALPAGYSKARAITFQHINYGNKQINVSDITNDTILVKALTFNVPGITVNKDPNMILRMKTYTRSYSFVDNMPVAISEGIRYIYFKNSDESSTKTKTISERTHIDKEFYDSQSVWVQAFADPESSMFFKINNYTLYDKLKDNTKIITYKKKEKIMVKYMKEDPKKQTCEIITDSGFVGRPFNFPLFRISITNLYANEKYTTKSGKPKLSNLLSYTRMMRVILNKTKKFIDIVDEYYPMEFDYITKEQMKEERKDKVQKPFVRPENMPELNPLIEKAIKKMSLKK